MEYEQRAILDLPTGLYNLRYLNEQFQSELERSKRYDLPLSLVLFRLGNEVRPTPDLSRAERDQLVKSAAALIATVSRKGDTFYRLSPLDFAALLPQTALEGAERYAQNIINRVESVPVSGRENTTLYLFVSLVQLQPLARNPDLSAITTLLEKAIAQATPAARCVRIETDPATGEPFPFQ